MIYYLPFPPPRGLLGPSPCSADWFYCVWPYVLLPSTALSSIPYIYICIYAIYVFLVCPPLDLLCYVFLIYTHIILYLIFNVWLVIYIMVKHSEQKCWAPLQSTHKDFLLCVTMDLSYDLCSSCVPCTGIYNEYWWKAMKSGINKGGNQCKYVVGLLHGHCKMHQHLLIHLAYLSPA